MTSPLPSVPTIDMFSAIGGWILNYVILFVMVIFTAIFAWAWFKGLWIFKRFPIKVMVIAERGGGFILERDQARLMKENNKDKYEFKKGAWKSPAFEYRDVQYGDWLLVYAPTREEYHPCFLNAGKAIYYDKENKPQEANALQITPIIRSDAKIALIDQLMENKYAFDYKSILKEFLPIIMFAIATMMVIILFWQVSNSLNSALGEASGIAKQQAETAIEMARLVNQTRQIPPIPSG